MCSVKSVSIPDLTSTTMKHRRRIAPILLAIALAFTALPALDGHAQGVPADPGLPGPYAAEQFNFTLQGLGATVFYPGAGGAVAAGGPFSGLVPGHGFARARAQHANNGVLLASHGFIVVTVDFPNPFSPDFDAWAAQSSAALDWLEAENANPASRFYQQIAVDRLGALGHSAGGMATWVAAGQATIPASTSTRQSQWWMCRHLLPSGAGLQPRTSHSIRSYESA